MAVYDLSDPLRAESFKLRCNKLYRDHAVVELSEKRPRTLRQNSYLHLILAYFGSQVGETAAYCKSYYFKRLCNPELFIREITDRITGETVEVLRSSSLLTKDEMSTAIDRFRNWAAVEAGIYIPDADSHLVSRMEAEASRCNQYI